MKRALLIPLGVLCVLSLRCATAQLRNAEASDEETVCEDEATTGSHIRQRTCRVQSSSSRQNTADEIRAIEHQTSAQTGNR